MGTTETMEATTTATMEATTTATMVITTEVTTEATMADTIMETTEAQDKNHRSLIKDHKCPTNVRKYQTKNHKFRTNALRCPTRNLKFPIRNLSLVPVQLVPDMVGQQQLVKETMDSRDIKISSLEELKQETKDIIKLEVVTLVVIPITLEVTKEATLN